jgi:hypothetical protein
MKKLFKHIQSFWIFLITLLFFVLALYLNHFYGSLLFSKITHKEAPYNIGYACHISRDNCERQYFKNYLDDIETIKNQTDSYFADIFIKEDQSNYTGNCPCPDDYDSRGSNCGGRSSYSKGGKISYCYRSDVPIEKIDQRRTELATAIQTKLDNEVQEGLNVYREKYTLYIIIVLFLGLLYWGCQKGIEAQLSKK